MNALSLLCNNVDLKYVLAKLALPIHYDPDLKARNSLRKLLKCLIWQLIYAI